MADALENIPVGTSLQSWLQQGEQLYAAALSEFRALESQLAELEAKLHEKQDEVNQIADKLGKPPIDGGRRLSAEIVPASIIESATPVRTVPTSNSNANIARALTGKFGR